LDVLEGGQIGDRLLLMPAADVDADADDVVTVDAAFLALISFWI
jgi:hypothetical protein